MDLPTYNGMSNEECDVSQTYFVSTCFCCLKFETPTQSFKRCSGCQLVAYCSKECQKKNWSKHKYVCKEFPVVDGKNALNTSGPWEEHVAGLRQRAALLQYPDVAKLVFSNSRVCHTCREARPDRLTDCKCSSVSYCSEQCAQSDKNHQDACVLLGQIAYSYSTNYLQDQSERGVGYTSTSVLLWALKKLGKCRMGRQHRLLKDLTTLNIHVIATKPLFYHEAWYLFQHQLPKLKRLNIVFVMQGNAFKSFKPNFNLSGLSSIGCKVHNCEQCEAKDRVITYSIQQNLYHMYFSSPQYTEPDFVVVYDNAQEMLASGEDDINSKISYSNMTYHRDTILVLADTENDLVKQGVRAVNAAQSVDTLGTPKRIFASIHDALGGSGAKYYFTCLRRSL